MAYDQIGFLGKLVNDLATLSRAEKGKLDIQVEEINVRKLVESLIEEFRPQAAKKQLTIEGQVNGNDPILKSSLLYVREVLQNFVSNAVKYTESGGVVLKAFPAENGIAFEVIDSGIGISHGDQDKIFDKFFRSEDFRTRKNNGTGLGLYVTMKLARLLHADIRVESQLNKGSTFRVTMPNLS
jgi:signal transduction histidine kinase